MTTNAPFYAGGCSHLSESGFRAMNPDSLSDEEILYIVDQTDLELHLAGKEIKTRSWEVPSVVMRKFGFRRFVRSGDGKPDILARIEAAFDSIYRKQDLATGGHIGVFMYRDIFARISPPHVGGIERIEPFNHVDLTPVQLRIIQTEPEEMAVFLDQFCDVSDIQYGFRELKPPFAAMEPVTRFIDRARLHLHAAAAILTGGYDYRGAVQSALLATELSLKSPALAQGLTEDEIKKRFGHNYKALADFIFEAYPAIDVDRVRRVLDKQPGYVANRYDHGQPRRIEVGHIVMGAQYVVAEIIRLLSDRNLRADFQPPLARHYPA